jgi:hypothetical protein
MIIAVNLRLQVEESMSQQKQMQKQLEEIQREKDEATLDQTVNMEDDPYPEIASMEWGVLRDYAISQRQRVEMLADELSVIRRGSHHAGAAAGAAATEVLVLREQLSGKEAELVALRADLAQLLRPGGRSDASKDDGEEDRHSWHGGGGGIDHAHSQEAQREEAHQAQLAQRYQDVVQAQQQLEDRSRREQLAKRQCVPLPACLPKTPATRSAPCTAAGSALSDAGGTH